MSTRPSPFPSSNDWSVRRDANGGGWSVTTAPHADHDLVQKVKEALKAEGLPCEPADVQAWMERLDHKALEKASTSNSGDALAAVKAEVKSQIQTWQVAHADEAGGPEEDKPHRRVSPR